jgi:Tfp pilus assembly protein PilF
LKFGKEGDGVAVLEFVARWKNGSYRIKKDYGKAEKYFGDCVKSPDVETQPEPWLMAGLSTIKTGNADAAKRYFEKSKDAADAVGAVDLVQQASDQLLKLQRARK